MNKKQLMDKYLAKLEEIQKNGDVEVRHGREDDLLCDLLIELGFEDIVELYKSSTKWYS